MLNMDLQGRRKRRRPQRRYIDVVMEDVQRIGGDRGRCQGGVRWRQMTCCGSGQKKKT